MKKLLFIGISAMLFLGACSEDTATEETNTNETQETSDQNMDTKKDFLNFYMTIAQSINSVDADLNIFEANLAEETLPEGEDLQAMKDAAIVSAEQAEAGVEKLEVPETLADQQEDIDSALALIQESYSMKAEELTKEEVSFEAANEKFQEADNILNTLLEEQELMPSSIYNEVTN